MPQADVVTNVLHLMICQKQLLQADGCGVKSPNMKTYQNPPILELKNLDPPNSPIPVFTPSSGFEILPIPTLENS